MFLERDRFCEHKTNKNQVHKIHMEVRPGPSVMGLYHGPVAFSHATNGAWYTGNVLTGLVTDDYLC